jgi:lipoate-protein ligase A
MIDFSNKIEKINCFAISKLKCFFTNHINNRSFGIIGTSVQDMIKFSSSKSILTGNVVILSRFNNPYKNVALGRTLSAAFKNSNLKSILTLSKSKPHVSIGRNQDCWSECKIDLMKKNNIELVRRDTGGGACYVDEGVLLFSIISRNTNTDFNFDFLTKSLHTLGFTDAKKSGRNDIVTQDHKISGSAFTLYPVKNSQQQFNIMRHHGTILHSVDKHKLREYLVPHKLKLEKHNCSGAIADKNALAFLDDKVASVDARICNLVDLQPNLSMGSLQKAIISGYSSVHPDVTIFDLDQTDFEDHFEDFSANLSMFTDPNFKYNSNHTYNHNFDITDPSNMLTRSLFRIQFDIFDNKFHNVSVRTDSTNLEITDILKQILEDHEAKSVEFKSNGNLVLDAVALIISHFNKQLQEAHKLNF